MVEGRRDLDRLLLAIRDFAFGFRTLINFTDSDDSELGIDCRWLRYCYDLAIPSSSKISGAQAADHRKEILCYGTAELCELPSVAICRNQFCVFLVASLCLSLAPPVCHCRQSSLTPS